MNEKKQMLGSTYSVDVALPLVDVNKQVLRLLRRSFTNLNIWSICYHSTCSQCRICSVCWLPCTLNLLSCMQCGWSTSVQYTGSVSLLYWTYCYSFQVTTCLLIYEHVRNQAQLSVVCLHCWCPHLCYPHKLSSF